jgi:predicted RNase H-like HicB family nuclease
MSTHLKLTMLIEKGLDGWYVGQIQEIPGVLTQGKTLKETKVNLVDALDLYLEVQRGEREREFKGRKIIREELTLA